MLALNATITILSLKFFMLILLIIFLKDACLFCSVVEYHSIITQIFVSL